MEQRILIIEDEERLRRLLELVLVEQGYLVSTAADGLEGMALWPQVRPDLVLTDLKMPNADGLEVLDFRNRQFQQVPLVLLTAYGTIQSAVAAIKQGAFDYLAKPVDHEQLVAVIAKALASVENQPRISHDHHVQPHRMIGSSPVMDTVRENIDLIATTRISVLLTGESGTGKELAARAIHAGSDRRDGPFTRVNCAAIPRDLLESELFGHRRGSFTGAVADRQGAFVMADGGTLFLDEIGDLPLDLQPKLLHAVEDKSVTPVGTAKIVNVDVKIIAATNQDLDRMVIQGRFRNDLYHRLNTFHLPLPPLRQRGNDLLELIDYFLELFCKEQDKDTLELTSDALRLFRRYDWPGNIRELRNVLERTVLICGKDMITPEMLPEKMKATAVLRQEQAIPSTLDLPSHEKKLILTALQQCAWNKSRSAKKLGITRNTLRYRIKKYDIDHNR
ncbi:MAG: sigma-54-dependent transcriptional regulator [Desulfobulbaceae bacterium]